MNDNCVCIYEKDLKDLIVSKETHNHTLFIAFVCDVYLPFSQDSKQKGYGFVSLLLTWEFIFSFRNLLFEKKCRKQIFI